MKTKTIAVITILFLAILILYLGCISATGAKEPSERFKPILTFLGPIPAEATKLKI